MTNSAQEFLTGVLAGFEQPPQRGGGGGAGGIAHAARFH